MGGSERQSPSRKALTTELEHVPPGAHPSDAAALAERPTRPMPGVWRAKHLLVVAVGRAGGSQQRAAK